MKKNPIVISDLLSLPIEAVTETFAFLAKRGKGKTYAAGVLVEEFSQANAQVVVIDPTDAWWGMKSSADGKSEGYPFIIFGGNHADIPLAAESGKMLAEFVVESGQSVIICTRLLSKGKARQLVGDFFEHVYDLKGHAGKNTPLFCMIDECDLFIPQMVYSDAARCVGAIDDVVRRGRNVGLGVGLVSQRAAKVNKDVLSQVECLVALQTSGPHDRKALREWIEANADETKMDEFISNLVQLQRGEAWFWSPSWLQILKPIVFRTKRTFDSSYTPKSGEARIVPRKLAEVDMEQVKLKMSKTIESAKANNPQVLQARIRELEAMVKKLQDNPMVESKVQDVPVISKDLEDDMRLCLKQAKDYSDEMIVSLKGLNQRFEAVIQKVNPKTLAVYYPENRKSLEAAAELIRNRAIRFPTPDNHAIDAAGYARLPRSTGSLSKSERAILTALAQYPQGRTKVQVALISGYSHNSGGFNNALGSLRSKQYMNSGSPLLITPAGLTVLGDWVPLPTGDALFAHWCARSSRCSKTVLQVLYSAKEGLTKEELGEATGYSPKSGGFNNALGTLRTLELIQRTDPIKISEDFFQ